MSPALVVVEKNIKNVVVNMVDFNYLFMLVRSADLLTHTLLLRCMPAIISILK